MLTLVGAFAGVRMFGFVGAFLRPLWRDCFTTRCERAVTPAG
jgi:hypothetical protein